MCISFVQVGGQLSYHGGLKWQAASPTQSWANVRCNGGLKTSVQREAPQAQAVLAMCAYLSADVCLSTVREVVDSSLGTETAKTQRRRTTTNAAELCDGASQVVGRLRLGFAEFCI